MYRVLDNYFCIVISSGAVINLDDILEAPRNCLTDTDATES